MRLIIDTSFNHLPLHQLTAEYTARGKRLVWRCGPLFRPTSAERHGNATVVPMFSGKRGRLAQQYTPGPGGDAA